jgi:hypothetical protein
MKSFARLLLPGLVAGVVTLAAQTTYTDDFAADYGYWDTDVTTLGGTLTRSGGGLRFTDGGIGTGQTSRAYRDVTFSASAGADWQVQVDFTLNLSSQVAGQVTMWSLYAASLTTETPHDYFVAELNQNYMQSGFRILNGSQYTGGSQVDSMGPVSLAAGTISVQLAFNAATQTLTLGYDENAATGGYSFTAVDSVSTATWLMASTDEFGFRLMGSNLANAGGTLAIGAGESFADDFSLTGAVIPEPAATSVALGVLALFTLLRRRGG